MRYHSKPQYTEFLTDPEGSFKTKSTELSSSIVTVKNEEEAKYQYNIELVCSSSEIKYYKIKSFLLASTDQ